MKHGFTLIELSIVLVIIGLIVGGVVASRDLIRSAALSSQVSQITMGLDKFRVIFWLE